MPEIPLRKSLEWKTYTGYKKDVKSIPSRWSDLALELSCGHTCYGQKGGHTLHTKARIRLG